jgi:hypothetical protein
MTGHDFEVVGTIPFEELEARLRAVTLLKQPDVRPYENADISLRRITRAEVDPTSRYAIKKQIEVQQAIGKSLVAQVGYDQLEMENGLIVVGGEKGRQGLIPPVVEVFEEEGVETKAYVIDGLHRVYDGFVRGKRNSFIGVFIKGIRDDCPPYAFRNGWDEVQEFDEKPTDEASWKAYRDFADRYVLYRDFGPINGSSPRSAEAAKNQTA